ncbi:unnamed protein product [Rotaria sp. Silwood2]|nr:unnamed protein product [Rotaria sp. Silwood2]
MTDINPLDDNLPISNTSTIIRIREYVSKFNIFQNESSTNNTQRQEILSTRLFITLVVGFTTILCLYTGLVERTTTITISNSSLLTDTSLQESYFDTLECPCSHLSIPYNEFIIFMNATFHPICTKKNFTSIWFQYFSPYQQTSIWWLQTDDFRHWSILFFNFLQKYCELASSTVFNAMEQFNLELFVSSEVMSPILFETKIHTTIQLFQKSTAILFFSQLQMFHGITEGNGFISTVGINMNFQVDRIALNAPILIKPKTYSDGTCSCGTSINCVELASFYNITHHKVYTIENIYTGCYLLESILHSSLSCFFSNLCRIDLMQATNLGNPNTQELGYVIDIPPLEFSSANSNFKINDTIKPIASQLFIDFWSSEISYERYYNACEPTHCTYLYARRFDVLYALTVFLSVINGLSVGLRSIVPTMVQLVYKLRNRFCS